MGKPKPQFHKTAVVNYFGGSTANERIPSQYATNSNNTIYTSLSSSKSVKEYPPTSMGSDTDTLLYTSVPFSPLTANTTILYDGNTVTMGASNSEFPSIFDIMDSRDITFWSSGPSLFNLSTGVYTGTGTTNINGVSTSGCWVEMGNTIAQYVAHYKMKLTEMNRYPSSWIIAGSNDNGTTWTNLHSVTNYTSWVSGVYSLFDITNPGTYLKLRIVITKNAGVGSSMCRIYDWKFGGKDLSYGSGTYKASVTNVNSNEAWRAFDKSYVEVGFGNNNYNYSSTPANGRCKGIVTTTPISLPWDTYVNYPALPAFNNNVWYVSTGTYGNGIYSCSQVSEATGGYVVDPDVWKAFDGNSSTSVYTSPGYFTVGSGVYNGSTTTTDNEGNVHTGGWIDFFAPDMILLYEMKITIQSVASGMSSIVLLGINPDGTYSQLYVNTNVTYTNNVVNLVLPPTATTQLTGFMGYRIVIKKVGTGSGAVDYCLTSEITYSGKQCSVSGDYIQFELPEPILVTTNWLTRTYDGNRPYHSYLLGSNDLTSKNWDYVAYVVNTTYTGDGSLVPITSSKYYKNYRLVVNSIGYPNYFGANVIIKEWKLLGYNLSDLSAPYWSLTASNREDIVYQAFDNLNITAWRCPNFFDIDGTYIKTSKSITNKTGGGTIEGEWIQMLSSDPNIVKSYEIFTGSVQYMKTYYLMGSNDGVTFDTLHSTTRASGSVYNSALLSSNFNNYKYIRFIIASTFGYFPSVITSENVYPPGAMNSLSTLVTGHSVGNGIYTISTNGVQTTAYNTRAFRLMDKNFNTQINFSPYDGTTGAYTGSVSTVTTNAGTILSPYCEFKLPNPIVLSALRITKLSSYPCSTQIDVLATADNGSSWKRIVSTTVSYVDNQAMVWNTSSERELYSQYRVLFKNSGDTANTLSRPTQIEVFEAFSVFVEAALFYRLTGEVYTQSNDTINFNPPESIQGKPCYVRAIALTNTYGLKDSASMIQYLRLKFLSAPVSKLYSSEVTKQNTAIDVLPTLSDKTNHWLIEFDQSYYQNKQRSKPWTLVQVPPGPCQLVVEYMNDLQYTNIYGTDLKIGFTLEFVPLE